jgi:hypothetical protein
MVFNAINSIVYNELAGSISIDTGSKLVSSNKVKVLSNGVSYSVGTNRDLDNYKIPGNYILDTNLSLPLTHCPSGVTLSTTYKTVLVVSTPADGMGTSSIVEQNLYCGTTKYTRIFSTSWGSWYDLSGAVAT